MPPCGNFATLQSYSQHDSSHIGHSGKSYSLQAQHRFLMHMYSTLNAAALSDGRKMEYAWLLSPPLAPAEMAALAALRLDKAQLNLALTGKGPCAAPGVEGGKERSERKSQNHLLRAERKRQKGQVGRLTGAECRSVTEATTSHQGVI